MTLRRNPWQTLQQKAVYDNPWIRIEHHDVITPRGTPGIYGKVCFKNRAVGIIPVDEQGNTWLVGQYRYTLDKWLWEIPMGGAPLDEDPEQAAHRDVVGEPWHARPHRADPSHQTVDLHAGMACGVQGLGHHLIGDRVAFERDPTLDAE